MNVFGNVVDFFKETWKTKPKPYKYNEYIGKKFKLSSENAQEIRDTSLQPTVFSDANGTVRYNKRKINELPMFISQLSSNISIVLLCECVYFDFDFVTGMFMIKDFSEIIDDVNRSNESSAYKLDEKSLQARDQMKLMCLIYLQCGSSMKDLPLTAVSQILSRSLNFYGIYSYFTKLIDEYDRQSIKMFPLVVAHQFIEAPGNDLLFQLDKHNSPITHTAIGCQNDSSVFTLSNILHLFDMTKIREMGQIQLDHGNFSFFIVYIEKRSDADELPLKDQLGGFVVATKNEIKFYRFDGRLCSTKKFVNKEILEIYLVSKSHLVVAFKNERYLHIYDLNNAEFIQNHYFEGRVLNIICNTHKKYINHLDVIETTLIYMAVLLETNEIKLFFFSSVGTVNNINLNLMFNVPASGFDVISMDFSKDPMSVYEHCPFELCATYTDGSLIRVCIRETDSVQIMKFKSNRLKNVSFKIIEMKTDRMLLLGSNGHLVFYQNEKKNFEIEGSFDDGAYLSSNRILSIKREDLAFHYIKPGNQDDFDVFKLGEVEAHFDDITFFFIKGKFRLILVQSFLS